MASFHEESFKRTTNKPENDNGFSQTLFQHWHSAISVEIGLAVQELTLYFDNICKSFFQQKYSVSYHFSQSLCGVSCISF